MVSSEFDHLIFLFILFILQHLVSKKIIKATPNVEYYSAMKSSDLLILITTQMIFKGITRRKKLKASLRRPATVSSVIEPSVSAVVETGDIQGQG